MLSQLTAGALADAAERRERVSLVEIERRAVSSPEPRDALRALAPTDHVRLIAEIKRSSPSKGQLASITDAPALASVYAEAGADAISVLTESRKFGGSLDDLAAVREAVDVPLLRKDFIAEEYQILEARAFGADIVLLIVAALDQTVLSRLHNFAQQLGLAVLVETHSADEVRRASDIGARLVGVNARNLSTFELDRELFGEVRHLIDASAIAVAESAVARVDDVVAYRSAGADVVLVGEALVTAGDPAERVHEFREVH
ncbi:MAG: indole-3-glycerol phosphate synthase TrpC [Microbacteriaceae bacterium]